MMETKMSQVNFLMFVRHSNVYFLLYLEHLMKLQMEELVEFLQESLAKDFIYEDDFVIDQLQNSVSELKRAKLDLPAAGKKLAHKHI